MKYRSVVVPLAFLLATAASFAATPSLPDFAGWHKVQSRIVQPTALPANEGPLLAEFGAVSIEQAEYRHEERRITVEGALFRDTSGAFGAYTYLRPENFPPFEVRQPHSDGVAGDNHILFYRGPWLIRADVDVVTAMTAPELRELAAELPENAGGSVLLPTLPLYLPKAGYIENSLRYSEGPIGTKKAETWLPADAIGFDQGAEIASARYSVAPDAQMMVISYPTPQIAQQRFQQLQLLAKSSGAAAPAFLLRRSGPLIAVVHGAQGSDARSLLTAVNYRADITWNEPAPIDVSAGLPRLILAIFSLCGILIALALGFGIATGSLRVLLVRLFPKKFARVAPGDEIIRLGLS